MGTALGPETLPSTPLVGALHGSSCCCLSHRKVEIPGAWKSGIAWGTLEPGKLESRNEPYIYIYDILGCGSMHGRVLVFGSWSLPLVPWLLVLGPWLLASGVLCSLCMRLAWPISLGPWLLARCLQVRVVEIPWLLHGRFSHPTWLWHHHGRTHGCYRLSFADGQSLYWSAGLG